MRLKAERMLKAFPRFHFITYTVQRPRKRYACLSKQQPCMAWQKCLATSLFRGRGLCMLFKSKVCFEAIISPSSLRGIILVDEAPARDILKKCYTSCRSLRVFVVFLVNVHHACVWQLATSQIARRPVCSLFTVQTFPASTD